MSISRLNCLEMPFYSKLMFPSKDCLQTFDGRASALSMLWGRNNSAPIFLRMKPAASCHTMSERKKEA